jgi:hypothetical protein
MLTGDDELDWPQIELMVRTCHALNRAKVPEWSTAEAWQACYKRVTERTEQAVAETSDGEGAQGTDGRAKRKKSKNRKRKGRPPAAGGHRIKADKGSVVVIGEKGRGRVSPVRISVTGKAKKLITGGVIGAAVLGCGTLYFVLDDDGTTTSNVAGALGGQPVTSPTGSMDADETASASPSGTSTPSAPPSDDLNNDASPDGTDGTPGSTDPPVVTPTTPTPTPASPEPDPTPSKPPLKRAAPRFEVTGGTCDVSEAAADRANHLSNQSSGFSDGGGTYNEIVAATDHSKPIAQTYDRQGTATNGRSGWHWLCEASDPPGTYDVRVKDVKTGLWSNWSRLEIVE